MTGGIRGLHELIHIIMNNIPGLEIPDFNNDFFARVLDIIAPIFNPVMERITEIIGNLPVF